MTNKTEAPETVMLAENGGLPTGNYPKQLLVKYTRDDLSDAQAARIAELEAQNRELALQIISSDGQAMDAYDAQMKAEQRAEAAEAKLRIYEGCNGQHVSSTGMIDEMAGALKQSEKHIAELKSKLKTVTTERVWCDNYAALEANMIKVMEHVMDYSNDPHLVRLARATLAELNKE